MRLTVSGGSSPPSLTAVRVSREDLPFREVICLDFEFVARDGERPIPHTLVAYELFSDTKHRLVGSELRNLRAPPYPHGPDTLTVVFYGSAEWSCYLALGWDLPESVLDLFVEYRNLTNGWRPPHGNGLLGAMVAYGLDGISVMEKEDMRALAMRGEPFSPDEWQKMRDYCESDVVGLAKLLPCMLPDIVSRSGLQYALLRGRYTEALAQMEYAGIPIDTTTLDLLLTYWSAIKTELVRRLDPPYGVYEGTSFRADRFVAWLAARGLSWPLTPTGRPKLDDDTFRDMAQAYPELAMLQQLRATLSQMRLHDLHVGADGRNRTMLSMFRAVTGRNAPSTTKFVFGPAVWLRSLIVPKAGYALAYIDWSQQEFGIAAALSGDPAMLAAYASGDPYLTFAQQAGAVPPHGTRAQYEAERELFKTCVLAVQYLMGAEAFARRINDSEARARELLRLHRDTYPTFWKWSDRVVDHAMLTNSLYTAYRWNVQVGPETNPRTLRNFPMQANGAEMLRLACCLVTERGITVCAPVHDALLIEAPVGEITHAVDVTQAAMEEASRNVLDGFRLRSDAKIVMPGQRYSDKRGDAMWKTVTDILGEFGHEVR